MFMSTPTRRIGSDCCARTTIGHAAAPINNMNSRRLIAAPEADKRHRNGLN
jgi:hypothetical protein